MTLYNSPYEGHFNGQRTVAKVLQSGFYWPTLFKDAHEHVQKCDSCQRTGAITRWHEMSLQNIQEIEVFDCWGIDFIGPLPLSFSNEYILLAVEYVSRWVEAAATQKVDAKTVIKFLKRNIFTRFGTPRVLISDGGSHFCNAQLQKVLEHYGVRHKVPTTILKLMVRQRFLTRKLRRFWKKQYLLPKRIGWSNKLDEALWAYKTTFKTPTSLSPFQLIYGEAYHLLVELEHKAYWAIKFLNFDPKVVGEKRKVKLHELEEIIQCLPIFKTL